MQGRKHQNPARPSRFVTCSHAPAQTLPDLAAGPDQFLAVFYSDAADVRRILAQRLDGQGNVIDAEAIEIGELTFLRAIAVPDHPVESISGLTVDRGSLQWMPAASATAYDVMWGTLDDLHATASVGAAECGWEDNPGTTLAETSDPPPGVGYYYLIRGDAPQLQAGTLDNVPGMSVPEGRDQEVGTAGGYSCVDMP